MFMGTELTYSGVPTYSELMENGFEAYLN